MLVIFSAVILTALANAAVGRERGDTLNMTVLENSTVILPCHDPGENGTLTWRAIFLNSPTIRRVIATLLSGQKPTVATRFKSAVAINKGNLVINKIDHSEEGTYWCEMYYSKNGSVVFYPNLTVQVFVRPETPEIVVLSGYPEADVRRCFSRGGKPASKLTWMNGTKRVSDGTDTVIVRNRLKNYLNDSFRTMVINPSRYDHNRTFSCVIDHPTYNESKILNYTVLANHHPYDLRIWADLKAMTLHCEAHGYPKPTYLWTRPDIPRAFAGPSIFVPDLFNLPGHEKFECKASNGFPPNQGKSVLVADVRSSVGWVNCTVSFVIMVSLLPLAVLS